MSKRGGRPKGSLSCSSYKWLAVLHDRSTDQIMIEKFCSVKELNKAWSELIGRELSSELVHRIATGYRADKDMKKGKSSFYQRWGHIQLKRINEPVIKS